MSEKTQRLSAEQFIEKLGNDYTGDIRINLGETLEITLDGGDGVVYAAPSMATEDMSDLGFYSSFLNLVYETMQEFRDRFKD